MPSAGGAKLARIEHIGLHVESSRRKVAHPNGTAGGFRQGRSMAITSRLLVPMPVPRL